MGLVDKHHKVLGEIVQQRHRRTAGRSVADYAGIVLYPVAVPELTHHLHVICCALAYTLRLHEAVVFLELLHSCLHFVHYALSCPVHLLRRCDIMGRRIYRHMGKRSHRDAGNHIYLAYPVYLVAEKLNSYGVLLRVHGEYLHSVPTDAEGISLKCHIIADISYLHELFEKFVSVTCLPLPEGDDHVRIVDWVTETVYA